MQSVDHVRLSADERELIILDQTQLPNRQIYLSLRTREELYRAIKELQIRGAPAIGIFAGFAMYVLAQQYGKAAFLARFREDAE